MCCWYQRRLWSGLVVISTTEIWMSTFHPSGSRLHGGSLQSRAQPAWACRATISVHVELAGNFEPFRACGSLPIGEPRNSSRQSTFYRHCLPFPPTWGFEAATETPSHDGFAFHPSVKSIPGIERLMPFLGRHSTQPKVWFDYGNPNSNSL